MADLNSQLDQVRSKENFLEKVARFIPGYNGYVNRDNSRELDTLVRNTLATNLDTNHVKLKNTVLNLSQRGMLFESDGIDKLDKKLQQVVNKFRSAARGYSGMFDVVKVKEDKLNQLYQFDVNLFGNVEGISAACTEMETNSKSGVDIKPSIEKVSAVLDEIIKQFDSREAILNSV
ncbi:MAG TPA: hypothetical protein VGK25_13715 [Ignavibacteria bacterium]|jgi:hypothetical protein